jgi:cell filamentation protein
LPAELAAHPISGHCNLEHLGAVHRHLFADLYEWAGQPRTVAIAKGDMFCSAQHIESYAADIFGRLARERHLTALPREQFVERLASYLGDVNALHPFREGNGRTQRAFFSQLAQNAGYRLDWTPVDRERNISASISAMRGDEQPLRALLDEITESLPG